jgi:hypothetical protein
MKKTELKDCPKRLMLADTKNEDVDITSSGWVIWNSGDFLSGQFIGGNFRGGVMMPHCKWIYGVDKEGLIKIGCKEKSIED